MLIDARITLMATPVCVLMIRRSPNDSWLAKLEPKAEFTDSVRKYADKPETFPTQIRVSIFKL
jgi:hypothetical protein